MNGNRTGIYTRRSGLRLVAGTICLGLLVGPAALTASAGPYAPAAGLPGSTAIHKDDVLFVGWASGWTDYLPGAECSATWQTPALATGKAVGGSFDIVCLGRGGQITLTFDRPISDGPGFDFAVFENAVTDTFLELAFVEVSSDGIHFVRFPNRSLTPTNVLSYAPLDPTLVTGYASKYVQGYGTPFDLAQVDGTSPFLDVSEVQWVRIVDIVGDGTATDSVGSVIYDPYPTIDSAGADIDAVGVINVAMTCAIAAVPDGISVAWIAETNRVHQLQFTIDPADTNAWTDLGPPIVGMDDIHNLVHTNPPPNSALYRVRKTLLP